MLPMYEHITSRSSSTEPTGKMSKSVGNETLVSIYRQIRNKYCVISQGTLAKAFKRECLSPSVKPESYNLFAQYRDGRVIKLQDEERLDEQIQECESLYVLRQGTDILGTLKTNLQPKGDNCPYAWIFDLPDNLMEKKVSEGDAVKLEKAIENIWGKLFLSLDFQTSELELELCDVDKVLREPISLMIKWQQRDPGSATFRVLLKELIELEECDEGLIDWMIIRRVVEENNKKNQPTADSKPDQASCHAIPGSTNGRMKKSAGIEASVTVFHETSRDYITIAQKLTVENFKKEFIWPAADTDSYEVLVQYSDDNAEILRDDQELDEQLQHCSGLLILPKGNIDLHFQGNTSADSVTVQNPSYAWVDELSDKIMGLRIKERDAVKLPACLQNILPELMLILEFRKGELEVAVHESKRSPLPGVRYESNLIRKWLEKDPGRATFGTLLAEMRAYEEVNPGQIEWNMMKRIVESASMKMEQGSG